MSDCSKVGPLTYLLSLCCTLYIFFPQKKWIEKWQNGGKETTAATGALVAPYINVALIFLML